MTLLLLPTFIAWGIILSNPARAQSREYLLKAGYIEKFTHFIEWPESEKNADSIFRIAVIGDSNFEPALNEIFGKVKVKGQRTEIRHVSTIEEVENCRILVISGPIMNLDEVLNYTTGKQILTISESKGYGRKGVIINLFVVDNYIRYEINQNSLQKSGLKMSSLLLNTALIVKSDE